ncbi:TetR/AcrR family transcriptional regulator [Oscillochloris sp. ZM17-4]|uniref:TetR/AcrR family transcriptional regulator n=1 Tax=Oscillochloris sp. ZM17-4 TaxID=2866714 RepID=UPI001C7339ED|nr:TetR/AcrR family transcriptional regulator [Oscillochloris sp. ZM17-4]MBX0329470.1 TetR/AcrR family transcriptional regulator [Oscillochloris sp. ZM17-4]
MARKVNAQEYAIKRAEILDVTWRLMYSKGYEQITIKDIIDELKISKGAFYHYFDSKQDLLEGILERLQTQGDKIFEQVMAERGLSTVARLQRFFDSAGRWKVAQKSNILSLLRGWYADENAVIRLRVTESMVRQIAPLLSGLIAQGVAEGELSTPFPDKAGEIALTMLVGMGDAFAKMLLTPNPQIDALQVADHMVAAYNDALERVLGARPGSLHLIDPETTREWFVAGGVQ